MNFGIVDGVHYYFFLSTKEIFIDEELNTRGKLTSIFVDGVHY